MTNEELKDKLQKMVVYIDECGEIPPLEELLKTISTLDHKCVECGDIMKVVETKKILECPRCFRQSYVRE